MKDGLVRADDLPLVFKALGCDALPRGAQVRVRITGTDEMTLDVHASLIERLDGAASASTQDAQADAEADTEEDEAAGSGPLTLALDLGADGEATPVLPNDVGSNTSNTDTTEALPT